MDDTQRLADCLKENEALGQQNLDLLLTQSALESQNHALWDCVQVSKRFLAVLLREKYHSGTVEWVEFANVFTKLARVLESQRNAPPDSR